MIGMVRIRQRITKQAIGGVLHMPLLRAFAAFYRAPRWRNQRISDQKTGMAMGAIQNHTRNL